MKRFSFLLLFFLLSILRASSQTHFITAGQTQGMIVTDCIPDIAIPEINFSSSFDSGSVSIDLNHDSINDFRIYRIALTGNNMGNILFKIFPFNENSILVRIDTCDYTDGTPYPQPFPLAKKFLAGDTMIPPANAMWVENGYGLIYRHSYNNNAGNYLNVTCTDLDYDSVSEPYYYLLKVIAHADTMFGYLHFKITINEILDYAIEGQDTTIIISSTNDLSTSNISISPNPFTNQINIGTDKAAEYQLTDYTGRVVLSGKTERSIGTTELAAGYYLLLLKNVETYQVKKMVKH